jgi:uncharacterized protein (TIGR02118 family)
MLELLAVGSDPEVGRAVATATGGIAYLAGPDGDRPPIYRSLVRAVTADRTALEPAADVGLHVVYSRRVKEHPVDWEPGDPTPGVVATFAMLARPGLTHGECDAHWRDVHAPLALRHHVGMWDYTQCSVVATISGTPYDGFALCGFASEQDLRERFFDGPEGQEAIRADVAKFADMERSPRRVLMTEWL